jgi:hypothetical protein
VSGLISDTAEPGLLTHSGHQPDQNLALQREPLTYLRQSVMLSRNPSLAVAYGIR